MLNDDKYSISTALQFATVKALVEHFEANSLRDYFTGLDATLLYPLVRSSAIWDSFSSFLFDSFLTVFLLDCFQKISEFKVNLQRLYLT